MCEVTASQIPDERRDRLLVYTMDSVIKIKPEIMVDAFIHFRGRLIGRGSRGTRGLHRQLAEPNVAWS